MSYQVLARKWRPSKFSEVVGQQHVVQALTNAMETGRLHHAYLLTGTRGVGKTTLGRILAKSLNCEQGPAAEPCGVCSACQEIDQGRFVDLIEIDAASRTKVEDTREILDNVQYRPTRGQYKVYLIDEVHMLSRHSFNALLKTLEEPPPHVKFLLATTDPQKLPVTILSRCLQFNLKAMTVEQIIGQLQHVLSQEQVQFEPLAVEQIARAAEGSMRDALSLTDQAIAHGQGQLTDSQVTAMLGLIDRDYVRALVNGLLSGNAEALMEQIAIVAGFAPDYDKLLSSLQSLIHRASLAALAPSAVPAHEPERELLQRLASHWAPEQLQLAYQILLQGRRDLAFAPDGRSGLEMILLRVLMFRPMHQLDLPKHEVVVPAKPLVEAPAEAASAQPAPTPAPAAVEASEPTAAATVAVTANSADKLEGELKSSDAQQQATQVESAADNELFAHDTAPTTEAAEASAIETAAGAQQRLEPKTIASETVEQPAINAEQSAAETDFSATVEPDAVQANHPAARTPSPAPSSEPVSEPIPKPSEDAQAMGALFDDEAASLESLQAQQDYILAMAEDQGFNPEPLSVEPTLEVSPDVQPEPQLGNVVEPGAKADVQATPTKAPVEAPANNHLKAPASSISAMLSARNQLRSQIKQLESERSGSSQPSSSTGGTAEADPEGPDRAGGRIEQTSAEPALVEQQLDAAAPITEPAPAPAAPELAQSTEAVVSEKLAQQTSPVELPTEQQTPSQEVAELAATPVKPLESPALEQLPDTDSPQQLGPESRVEADLAITQAPGAAGVGQVKSWWEQLIDTLGFDALKRQLALDCVLEPAGNGYVLQVPEKAKHLATEANLSILLERIHSYVGLNTPIDVQHEASIDTETPRQAQGRRAEERQQEAEQTIAEDPIVKQLQQTFDAVVDQDTIRPI